jgi:hypothetical protein
MQGFFYVLACFVNGMSLIIYLNYSFQKLVWIKHLLINCYGNTKAIHLIINKFYGSK